MPEYRLNRIEGGTYFFTLALADRHSDLLVQEVAALRASASRVLALYPFTIDAWVVLPDHLHAVWTLPNGDADFSTRWTLIKRGFSARLPNGETRSASRIAKGERGIWQRRFWEHTIRDEADFAPRRLRPLQPGQAWYCLQRTGLALLVLSARGSARGLSS
jgi:putative transposase